MSTLHLVRHGQASAGSADYDRLSERGREQSRLLGEWWKSHGVGFDAAYSGTLRRQRETLAIALEAASLDPHRGEHGGLDEYDHRAVDGRHGGGVRSDDPESLTFEDYVTVMRRWRDAEEEDTLESWTRFAARGWAAVRDAHALQEGAGRMVFFTSGGVISTLLATVLGLDFDHTIDAIWRIRNASITTLHYDGRHARLVEFNTVPHLEERRDPTLVTLI